MAEIKHMTQSAAKRDSLGKHSWDNPKISTVVNHFKFLQLIVFNNELYLMTESCVYRLNDKRDAFTYLPLEELRVKP